jgi:hypothetical protein
MELSMSPDPLAAVLDQLAAHDEQIARLDRTMQDVLGILAKLAAFPPADRDDDDHLANPIPKWWKLQAEQRREPLSRLRAWVEQVYRPGYGHLAATLGPAGRHTTCACTGSTSSPSSGRCSTSRSGEPPDCCPPRPNTTPESCPPYPHSS